MEEKILVRYEPYFNDWITMDEKGSIYSVEFDSEFIDDDYPNIKRIKPDWEVQNACSIPIVVQILLTKRCNYQCPHCPVVDNSLLQNEMSTEEVLKLLDYCADNGVLFVRFSGGESTLRQDFPAIVKYARSKGLRCGLLSNCRQYREDVMEVLHEMSYMQTHLDSVNRDTFNKLTGGNNFDSFCKTIKEIRAKGVTVNAATTLMKENMHEIKSIIEFCAEYQLVLKINTIYSDSNGKFHKREWLDYYQEVILPFQKEWPILKQYAEQIGCTAYCFCDLEEVDKTVTDPISVISPWGRSYIVVDSIGDIYPFSLIVKPQFKLGSIRDNDLIKIWKEASLLKELRSYTKQTLGCGDCRMDCVYCNLFFSYSYFGEFGHVLPHDDCPYGKFRLEDYE